MTSPRGFALLIAAILFAYTEPAQAHMSKECLISIVKLNLSSDAARRLNTAWAIGQLLGLTFNELNKIKEQRDIAAARKNAALPNPSLTVCSLNLANLAACLSPTY